MSLASPSLTIGVNSYATNAEAQAYFANRLDTDVWSDATNNDQIRAVITASANISLIVKAAYKLPLATIDTLLKSATYELALAMLTKASTITQSNTSSNIKKVGAGSAAVEFFAPTQGGKFNALVMSYLQAGDFIDSPSSAVPSFGAGTDCPVIGANNYGRTVGFGQ